MSTILIIPLIVFFFAIAIILKLNQAKIKGRFGEMKVSSILKSLPDNYHVFNDIYLQINGMSVQIDHIVISVYGIFVIETKNYTGWIFGTDNSEQWTKNVYGNKYEFRNPLKQNYAHVKALQCLLGLSKEKFIPAVVFLRGAVLKCNTQGTVIYSSQLKQFILSHTSAIIDSSNISKLTNLLVYSLLTDKEMKKNHIVNIRQKIHQDRISIYNGICPKCGNKLVERKGQYGEFIGCSNYPNCKFTTHK